MVLVIDDAFVVTVAVVVVVAVAVVSDDNLNVHLHENVTVAVGFDTVVTDCYYYYYKNTKMYFDNMLDAVVAVAVGFENVGYFRDNYYYYCIHDGTDHYYYNVSYYYCHYYYYRGTNDCGDFFRHNDSLLF